MKTSVSPSPDLPFSTSLLLSLSLKTTAYDRRGGGRRRLLPSHQPPPSPPFLSADPTELSTVVAIELRRSSSIKSPRLICTDSPSQPILPLYPDEADDLWLAYNLIAEGDTVLAVTVRKVLREAASRGRESQDAERVKLKLEIKVEAMVYDKEGSILRIRGKNILENEHVKIGAFHTLEIQLHRPFVLRKVCGLKEKLMVRDFLSEM